VVILRASNFTKTWKSYIYTGFCHSTEISDASSKLFKIENVIVLTLNVNKLWRRQVVKFMKMILFYIQVGNNRFLLIS
jgi:hypothetical protein